MLRIVKRLVPRSIKRRVRLYREKQDKARLFGALAPLVPPVEAMFDGPASLDEFKANGEEFLAIYREICGLRPDERMLDVGSGMGRKTLPLTRYLNDRAVYRGIEISRAGVDWCRETITGRFPNFQFQHIDVRNELYNPQGSMRPAEYRFPFADESFTFVVLGSVFTHMLPEDVARYLGEIRRVLAVGGRCLISYFLLNEESLGLIEAGRSTLAFGPSPEVWRTISPELPERAIAFDEAFIRDLYRDAGLTIARLDRGSWCGRGTYLSYQDLILAEKA